MLKKTNSFSKTKDPNLSDVDAIALMMSRALRLPNGAVRLDDNFFAVGMKFVLFLFFCFVFNHK